MALLNSRLAFPKETDELDHSEMFYKFCKYLYFNNIVVNYLIFIDCRYPSVLCVLDVIQSF